MKTIILQFLIFGLAAIALADQQNNFSITTNEEANAKQILKNYKNGIDVFTATNTESFRQIIGYYLLHTNDIPLEDKAPIGTAFAMFGMYDQAIKLGKEYVAVYSTNWDGWELLGGCYYAMGLTNDAINAYGIAARAGDKDSYEPFAGLAIINGRLETVEDMIPKLMTLKNDKETSKKRKLHLISILLFYSMKADKKEVFIKTLDGENIQEIIKDDDVKHDIKTGCEIFKGEDIDKIRQEMESAATSTNSVSSPSR